MISLYTGRYTEDDYEVIQFLTENMTNAIPCYGDCIYCRHKTACRDLKSFAARAKYLAETVTPYHYKTEKRWKRRGNK